jgi:plasmid stabilization system protein ParE
MRLRYSAQARLQLDASHDYLKERSAAAAHDVFASIKRSAERLTRSPELGMKTDEGNVRVLIEPDYLYRIFYEVRDADIFVIRVLHRAQER